MCVPDVCKISKQKKWFVDRVFLFDDCAPTTFLHFRGDLQNTAFVWQQQSWRIIYWERTKIWQMPHKKKQQNNKGIIVVLEFIKPNYHKIQNKKTGSGSEADQALSLTTNLRRDSRVVNLHNWRYFLAFFRWAEASAKRARSAKPAQQPASRTLAFACLKNARK